MPRTAKSKPSKQEKQQPGNGIAALTAQLWQAAVNLRGSIEPADYKRYELAKVSDPSTPKTRDRHASLEDVFFSYDRAELTSDALAILARDAAAQPPGGVPRRHDHRRRAVRRARRNGNYEDVTQTEL